METPNLIEDVPLKNYSLTSNKSNKYQINFFNRQGNNLYIKTQKEGNLTPKNYEGIFSLEKIKENQFFYIYNSLNEILDEIFPLIENGKAELKEENNILNLIINLPIKKVKEVSFILKENEKSDKNKINELYQIVSNLQQENCELKKINENLIKKIENLEKRVNLIEEINKPSFIKISSIIKTLDNYDFIVRIIKENIINKNVEFKFLYWASNDGDDSKIFHQKCYNNTQILVIFITTKGIIFGGYTEIGYKSKGNSVIDNKAFFFSCDRKKVYKVKTNKTAILDSLYYGPIFGNSTTMIDVQNKMLSYKCCTTTINSSCFENLNCDYEISNGECYFYLKDIEVFKILFQ